MGWLSSLEDLQTGVPILTPRPIEPQGDLGWEHRNATFTIANVNYGASPFGGQPAPKVPRVWPWSVRCAREFGKSLDRSRDDFALAIGQGKPCRLVWTHDDGYERVVTATPQKVTIPYTAQSDIYWDFQVQFEILEHWHERGPVDNAYHCGQASPQIFCGQTTPTVYCGDGLNTVAITADTFNAPSLMIDSSVAGPGGIANMPDMGPIIEIAGGSGGYGGVGGFQVFNLTDPYQCYFNCIVPPWNGTAQGGVPPGWTYRFDCGAWSLIALHPAVPSGINLSGYLRVPETQPYMFAINPGIANQIRLVPILPAPNAHTGSTLSVLWRRFFL